MTPAHLFFYLLATSPAMLPRQHYLLRHHNGWLSVHWTSDIKCNTWLSKPWLFILRVKVSSVGGEEAGFLRGHLPTVSLAKSSFHIQEVKSSKPIPSRLPPYQPPSPAKASRSAGHRIPLAGRLTPVISKLQSDSEYTRACTLTIQRPGTSLSVGQLRLRAPNTGGPGSIPGQGTRSRVLQLRACMLQLEIPHAATKTRHDQINR